ncbi:hypothetical protein WN943_006345 [Citrus x changshan-huyou]
MDTPGAGSVSKVQRKIWLAAEKRAHAQVGIPPEQGWYLRSAPANKRPDEKFPGLARFDHQFLLFIHFIHQTRNWGTGVECIRAPEHGGEHEPTRDGYNQGNIPTRGIYRADIHPRKSGNTIPQNRSSYAFPEPSKDTRDPRLPTMHRRVYAGKITGVSDPFLVYAGLRDCPKRTQLNAMVKEMEAEPSNKASTSRMNPLQLMNTLREEVVCNDFNQGLMVMTVLVDGREVHAILDTGATTKFFASYEVTRLGLKVTAVGSKVKAVNSASVGVQVAVQSSLRVGTWQKTIKTITPICETICERLETEGELLLGSVVGDKT